MSKNDEIKTLDPEHAKLILQRFTSLNDEITETYGEQWKSHSAVNVTIFTDAPVGSPDAMVAQIGMATGRPERLLAAAEAAIGTVVDHIMENSRMSKTETLRGVLAWIAKRNEAKSNGQAFDISAEVGGK
jgi:hypothetical protein